ncbi:MAG: carboxymuconolactone decarboxylase family protein [Promethearchaeota archaeon]
MVDNAKGRLTEIKRLMGKIGEKSPEFLNSFLEFKEVIEKDGALNKKTKKLIAIALSIVTKCEWCASMHAKEALDEGISPEEIMETCYVATLMGGAPALMFSQNVINAVEEFKK